VAAVDQPAVIMAAAAVLLLLQLVHLTLLYHAQLQLAAGVVVKVLELLHL
jgi:hypothetical protein